MLRSTSAAPYVVILLLLVTGCAEYKGSLVGADYIQRANPGNQSFMKIYAAPSDTSYLYPLSPGGGNRLMVGTFEGVHSHSLFQFTSLPLEGTIDSAYLILYLEKTLGSQKDDPVFMLYRIGEYWQDTTITASGIQNASFFSDSIITSVEVMTDTFQLSIPADWIQAWIDTASIEMNYGISLGPAPSDTGAVHYFYSYDETSMLSKLPRLRLYYTADTTAQNATIPPYQDVFVAWDGRSDRADRLTVSNGISRRTLLYFPTDMLPEDATINLALLTLHVDTLLSYPDNTGSMSIASYATTGPWSPPDISYDNSVGMRGSVEGDSATVNITFFYQNWNAALLENHGLLLLGESENNDLASRSFYSQEADQRYRPSLTIFYSLPPSSQW